MKDSYTYNDYALVQLLYREMPGNEAAALMGQLDADEDLQQQFTELAQAKVALPKVQFMPSSAVLNNILQYSAKTALEAQH
jgi:hypothetical protein